MTKKKMDNLIDRTIRSYGSSPNASLYSGNFCIVALVRGGVVLEKVRRILEKS